MIKRSYGTKATALLAAVAFLGVSAGVSSATIGDEAKCRATIAKNGTKLTATVGKNQRGCTKNVLKGKQTLLAGQKCHQNSTSDGKGKADKGANKLRDAVGGAKDKCPNGSGEHAITLAAFGPNCSVGGAGGEAVTPSGPGGVIPINDFSDVAECQISAAIGAAELVFGEILNPDYGAIYASVEVKGLTKCVDAIAKNAIKAIATIGKSRTKAQNATEKNSGATSVSYTQHTVTHAKIDGAVFKMREGITKACTDSNKAPFTTPDLLLLGSCTAASVTAINDCVEEAVRDTGEGVVSVAYINSGELPGDADVTIIPNSVTNDGGPIVGGSLPAGRISKTRHDRGFAGGGHGGDVGDFQASVTLDCGGDGVCDVDANCSKGNCRCESPNNHIECDEPFSVDVDDCGAGNECELMLGPPAAFISSSFPICVTNIVDDLSGSVDLSNGNTTTLVATRAVLYTDEGGQSQPCPICDNDTTPNDGSKGGTCVGGPDHGDDCDENGFHPTFGPTSYDCEPALGNTLNGAGQPNDLELSDEPATLTAEVACLFPFSGLTCHCLMCSGDTSVPCNTDLDCSSVGAGTCTANIGPGATPQPNDCADDSLVCGPDGFCPTTEDKFCDGFLQANGKGVIGCLGDFDCSAFSTECPGADCGLCTLTQKVPCFEETIDLRSQTNSGGNTAVLATTYCQPATGSGIANAVFGWPGPAAMTLALDLEVHCDDGTTEYLYGGINCP